MEGLPFCFMPALACTLLDGTYGDGADLAVCFTDIVACCQQPLLQLQSLGRGTGRGHWSASVWQADLCP